MEWSGIFTKLILTHSLQTQWQDFLRVRAAVWREVGGRKVEVSEPRASLVEVHY